MLPRFIFDKDKAIEAILYILNNSNHGRSGFHRISKLLYFADQYHLDRYASVLSGDTYKAMKYGPVPESSYGIMSQEKIISAFTEGESSNGAFKAVGEYNLEAIRKPDLDYFSETEIEALDYVLKEFGHKSFNELTNLSHGHAWNSVELNGTISIEDIIEELSNKEAVKEHLTSY